MALGRTTLAELHAGLEGASAALERGDLTHAVDVLARLFDASRPGDDSTFALIDLHCRVGLWCGEIHEHLDHRDGAVSSFSAVRKVARTHGHVLAELWAAVKLVGVHAAEHDLDTALSIAVTTGALVEQAEQRDWSASKLPGPDREVVVEQLLALGSSLYYDAENYDGAAATARLVVALEPDSAAGLLQLGLVQLRQEAGEAVETWRRLADAVPDQAFVHTNLAAALGQAGDLDGAVGALTTSIELVGDDPRTWHARGDYRRVLGRLDSALADYETVIALAGAPAPGVGPPESGPVSRAAYEREMPARDRADLAALARVAVLDELGRTTEAVGAAQELVEDGDDVTSPHASSVLAGLLARSGDLAAARRALDVAIDRDPAIVGRLRLERAALSVEGGLHDAAVADLDAVAHEEDTATGAIPVLLALAALDPAPQGVDRALGHAYLTTWFPAKAHAHLEAAAAAGPLDATALLWRALAVITVGAQDDPDEAAWASSLRPSGVRRSVLDLAAAHRLAPDDEEVRRTLRWTVDRAVQDSSTFTLLGAGRLVSGPQADLWPGFELIGELWRAANLGSTRQWGDAVAAIESVRGRLVAAGLPLTAALADVLAADSYLRLYELQRADDHLAAAEEAMRHFGEPLASHLAEESSSLMRAGDASGIPQFTLDFDHMFFVLNSTHQLQSFVRLLRIQLAGRTGDWEAAAELLEEAELDGLVDSFRDGSVSLQSVLAYVVVLRDLGRLDDALELAESLRGACTDDHDLLASLNACATVLTRLDESHRAEQRLREALEVADRLGPESSHVVVGNISTILVSRGDHEGALRLLDDHPAPENLPYPQAFGRLVVRGSALLGLGRNAEAQAMLVGAVDLHERIRAGLRSVADRVAWQARADESALYERSIRAAVAAGDGPTALSLVERSKARSFVDQLANGPLPENAASAERQEQLHRVGERLELLEELGDDPASVDHEIVRRLLQLGGSDPREIHADGTITLDVDAVDRATQLHRSAVLRLQGELDEMRAALVEGVVGEIASVDSLTELLRKESRPDGAQVTLVEYYVAGDWSAVFVVTSAGLVAAQFLELGEEELLDLAERTFAGLEDPLDTDLDEWVERTEQLVRPVQEHTRPGDLVWLVPYGPLHYLPLHAAVIGQSWMVERNPVTYSPSASVLPYCLGRRAARGSSALVLGDSRGDLVHARHEAELVAERLGTEALVTDAVRRETVLERLGRPEAVEFVHVACHGFFDPEEPFRSGLAMAAADLHGNDDTLTVKDLQDVRLDAGLVALSACWSGVSALNSGDELIGLSRAVLHAGASSMLVSLWMVDDCSTALLMKEFYAELQDPGRDPVWARPEAMRRAQISLMDATARDVAEALTVRLATASPATAAVIELDLAGVHASAGDLAGAVAHAEAAVTLAGPSPLGLQASAYVESLEFNIAVQQQAGRPDIDWEATVFDHPAYWAGFVVVGDWSASGGTA